MASTDIDRLYQLPLNEFTAARNALAKFLSGTEAAEVKALEKPSVPAWAVNQLYWRERRTFDALVRASERLRAGHAHTLHGKYGKHGKHGKHGKNDKKVDLAMLELQHRAAVGKAADAVREILARAGDAATTATLNAVVDTLQALPGGGAPGRLTKPLAPIGFGALGALLTGAATSKSLAEVVTFAPPKPSATEAADAAKRAREAARSRLEELDGRSGRAEKAVRVAREALARADRALAALEAKTQAASADVTHRRGAVDRAEHEARAIELERTRLQAALKSER